jgi:hypothetical protein
VRQSSRGPVRERKNSEFGARAEPQELSEFRWLLNWYLRSGWILDSVVGCGFKLVGYGWTIYECAWMRRVLVDFGG